MTARPWSLTPGLRAELAAQGLGTDAIMTATGVVAMFNYLTRVADASGIEFDYNSPLPVFQPDRDHEPAPRPDRAAWPVVPVAHRTVSEAWQHWREYVLDTETLLTSAERRLLAAAAAQECCDSGRADELAGAVPANPLLETFARKLSRQPWHMNPADLQALRAAGYPEPALLHAIAVVALQNAESRLVLGQAFANVTVA